MYIDALTLSLLKGLVYGLMYGLVSVLLLWSATGLLALGLREFKRHFAAAYPTAAVSHEILQ